MADEYQNGWLSAVGYARRSWAPRRRARVSCGRFAADRFFAWVSVRKSRCGDLPVSVLPIRWRRCWRRQPLRRVVAIWRGDAMGRLRFPLLAMPWRNWRIGMRPAQGLEINRRHGVYLDRSVV